MSRAHWYRQGAVSLASASPQDSLEKSKLMKKGKLSVPYVNKKIKIFEIYILLSSYRATSKISLKLLKRKFISTFSTCLPAP
jgi:hypothetical protein